MVKRIRIEKVEDIDFNDPAVVKSLAKAYAVLLKDKDSKGKNCK